MSTTPPEPVTALLRDAKEAIVFLLQSAPTQGNRLSPDWLSALVNRLDALTAPSRPAEAGVCPLCESDDPANRIIPIYLRGVVVTSRKDGLCDHGFHDGTWPAAAPPRDAAREVIAEARRVVASMARSKFRPMTFPQLQAALERYDADEEAKRSDAARDLDRDIDKGPRSQDPVEP